MAHLNSVGSWENKLPDNTCPAGPSLMVTPLLRRAFVLWRWGACGLFLHDQGLIRDGFKALSRGWKVEAWSDGLGRVLLIPEVGWSLTALKTFFLFFSFFFGARD